MLGSMGHASELDTDGAPHSARQVSDEWARLISPTTDVRSFTTEMVADLPGPVARWLTHVMTPGSPLLTSVVLTMSGRIKIGQWRDFQATQAIAACGGYIWAATAQFGPLPVRGFDRYSDHTGEMRWRLAGFIPVMSVEGDDVTRSAAGRLASELILTPAAALSPHVRWESMDDHAAVARVDVDGINHDVTIVVADDGSLSSAQLLRWGDPDGIGCGQHLFTALCTGERRFGDVVMPAHVEAGWGDVTGDGVDGAFIEFDLEGADFR